MDATRYLDHVRDDARRLTGAARAAGEDAKVPSCPDWNVRDLVEHVGAVYSHRVRCMRLGREPSDEEWPQRPEAGQDLYAWFDERLAELLAELVDRGPGAPSFTFFPPGQTVGFWYRRMAQETVMHRVDAELAAGAMTPVDDDLAADGVDELLAVFLGGPWWERRPVPGATGSTFAVRTRGGSWLVRLDPANVTVTRGDADAVASVEGEPADLLMWLWGRQPGGVRIDGDVTELRSRLDVVTR